jgi:hypothetical protein
LIATQIRKIPKNSFFWRNLILLAQEWIKEMAFFIVER